jgi:hypothetical protein
MKNIIHALVLLFLALNSNAQNLTHSKKKELKKELKSMDENDQLYRKLMASSPEMNNDSIWNLQTYLDSINKVRFVEITKLYGYPSRKNIGHEASIGLILHFRTEEDFIDLKELFKSELEKGNMLAEYYALWYDRCLSYMNKPIYYGQGHYINKKEFCGDELITLNIHRKEIGLKPLEGKETCN